MRSSDQKKPTPAKKSLGQNFLINPTIATRIVDACELKKGETVLEIGPGKGAITKRMADRAKHVVAVEKDKRLIQKLKNSLEGSAVEVIQHDILTFDLRKAGSAFKIVGNLPYNIATPILKKVINHRDLCLGFYFMVQKEYADRIVAREGSRTYGALSCFVQYYADVKILFNISAGNFRPIPKVRSAFLKCEFYEQPVHPAADEELLFSLIRKAFQQRRKTLENALKTVIDKTAWQELSKETGIDPQKRPEQIPLEQFVALANALKE